MRGLPGAAFRFCWSPALGAGDVPAKGTESCYPGDSYVDEIGVDFYDFTQRTSAGAQFYPGETAGTTTVQQQEVLDSMLTQRDSLRGWYSLALNHGKPLSFPEWGLVLWKTGRVISAAATTRCSSAPWQISSAGADCSAGTRCGRTRGAPARVRPRYQAWAPDPGTDEPDRVPAGVRLMTQHRRAPGSHGRAATPVTATLAPAP